MRCLCCSVNRVKRALHRFALWENCFVFSFPLSLTMCGKWEVGCAVTLEGSVRFGLCAEVQEYPNPRQEVQDFAESESKSWMPYITNSNLTVPCNFETNETLFQRKKRTFLIEVYGRITHMPLFRYRLFSEHCSSLIHKKQSLQKPNSCNFSNFFFPKRPLIPSLMMVINKVTLWQLRRMLNHWERQSDVGERRQRNFFPPYSEKFYLCSLNSLEQHATPHN